MERISWYHIPMMSHISVSNRLKATLIISATALLMPISALASVYGGTGIDKGINDAAGLGGISNIGDIRTLIVSIIEFVLDFVLLLAVIAVIVAGLYLIVSNGDEQQKDKAKRIILYVVIGIIVIVLSRILVMFVNSIFS